MPFCKTSIMLPPRHSRRIAVLALALMGWPVSLHAQDTLRVPSTTAPRVNLPAGTRITRPPVTANPAATVARPPASTGTAVAAPAQQIVTVPNLAGRTVDEARRLLAAAGLEVGSVAEGAGSGTPGTVMQQQPRAGSAVAPKSDVRLWVVPAAVATTRPPLDRPPAARAPAAQPADTPGPSLVTVPRLAGRTVEDARALLARLGLEPGAVAELAGGGEPGTILRQSPQAGARVAPRTGVRMWIVATRVAQAPAESPAAVQRVAVPNLAGQTVEDARRTLAAAGLALGPLAEAAGTGTPGTVARQQPAAGASVAPDARVRLWLVPARGAVVPALMGLPLDRAQALLRQAGLRPGQVAGEGRVIGHTYEAGASVPLGAVVNLSLGVPAGSAGQVAQRVDPPSPAQPRPDPPGGPQPTLPVDETPVPGTPPVTPPSVAQPVAPPDSAAGVPDVRRLALAQAKHALAAAGFTAAFDIALADSAHWVVSNQQPSPGGRLAAGGVVALLLDPPPSAPVAAVAGDPPPAAGGEESGRLTVTALFQRGWPWLALAALLAAAVAIVVPRAQRMRARARVLPVAGVRARLRMDEPARVAVEGDPFAPGRLRFRMNPGRSAARVAAGDSIFVRKEVSVD